MEKILERVRKLLAMANDERGNEGERDNALRMANNLMAKYQLDMADIPTEVRERDDPIGRFDVDGWYIPWCNMIRGSVARLFSCKYLQGGKINATRGRHIFIGRASNATTAMLMSDWIVKEALREADRVAGHRLTPAGRSFGLGVASSLARRVTELLEKSAAELSREQGSEIQSNGRDLVMIRANELSAADEWMRANIKVGKARATRAGNLDYDAMNAGRSHADKINLNKQVQSRPDPKSLK
jgi:hypothetical protein